jgi:hypothetical protein
MSASKNVEKREPLHTVGGNANKDSHYRKQYESSLKKKTTTKTRTIILFSNSITG